MPDANSHLKPNISLLRERAELLRELRTFFDGRGFLEVQPPCLSRDCIADAYIDPLQIESRQFALADQTLPPTYFMQTSPELAMKRMLAAGAPSIYAITPVFRAGESGTTHNVEFTMLEWYDVGANLESGVQLLCDLTTQILSSDQCTVTTYRQAFRDYASIDPIDASLEQIQVLAADCDSTLAQSIGDDRDGLLDVLMSEKIQPTLQRPTIVTHYPISQAALAKVSADDPSCAARFELFASGVELANGYDELLDAQELIVRTKTINQKRIANGRRTLQLPQTLIDSMRSGLPQCAGVALGVDRLLMVRAGVNKIEQVIPFTSGRA